MRWMVKALLWLGPWLARADSPLYELVRTQVFDLDAELGRLGVRADGCEYRREPGVNPPTPALLTPFEFRDSKRLGSCLFENAFDNASSERPAGHVRAMIRFRDDKPQDKPAQVFMAWRPTQFVSRPKHWLELTPVLGHEWGFRNGAQAARALRHYLDNEIVLHAIPPVPAGRVLGSSFLAKVGPKGKPVQIEKIVFRMETLPPEEVRAALKRGVREPKAKGRFLAYEPGRSEPSFEQEFVVRDLSVQPELRFDRGPWKILGMRTQFRVDTQTPGMGAEHGGTP